MGIVIDMYNKEYDEFTEEWEKYRQGIEPLIESEEKIKDFLKGLDESSTIEVTRNFIKANDDALYSFSGIIEEMLLSKETTEGSIDLSQRYVEFGIENLYTGLKYETQGHVKDYDFNKILKKYGVPRNNRIDTFSNKIKYFNKEGDPQMESLHRIKTSIGGITIKMFEYLLGKRDKIPNDISASKIIVQKPRHLYILKNCLENLEFLDKIDEINLRGGLPEFFDYNDVSEIIDESVKIGKKYAENGEVVPKEYVEKMIIGVWMDLHYKGLPTEVQILTDRTYMLMEVGPVNHAEYKKNRDSRLLDSQELFNGSGKEILKHIRYIVQRSLPDITPYRYSGSI